LSNQANIRDIQVLDDLKAGFGRFGEELQQILPALQKRFEIIQEQLDERQKHWRQQSDDAKDAVDTARQELSECQEQGSTDDDSDYTHDCGNAEEQVTEAERHLTDCQDNLETVKQWRHRIEGLMADFQNDMNRLSLLSSSRTSLAQAFLASKIEILAQYVGGAPLAAGSPILRLNPSIATIQTVALPAGTAANALSEKPPANPDNSRKELYFSANIRNARFAGKKHPITGIPFDKFGFPDFSSVAIKTVEIKFTGNRRLDRCRANKAAGIEQEPRGYIWHHHENTRLMLLVPKDIHEKTGHTGGAAGTDNLYTQSFA
jgi:hypothetical protein